MKNAIASLRAFLCLALSCSSFHFFPIPTGSFPSCAPLANNLRADFGFNIRTIFVHFFPAQGATLGWIFTIGLFLLLGYEWSSARSGDCRRFYWAACLSLAVAPLLGFRTEMEHLSVLIIPLALVFAIVHDRWRRLGSALTILLMLVIFSPPVDTLSFCHQPLWQQLPRIASSSSFPFAPSLAYTGFAGGRSVRRAS